MKKLKDTIIEKLNIKNINLSDYKKDYEKFGNGEYVRFNSSILNDNISTVQFDEKLLKELYEKYIPKDSIVYCIRDKDANFDILGKEKFMLKSCKIVYHPDKSAKHNNQFHIYENNDDHFLLCIHIFYDKDCKLYNDLYFYDN